MNVVRVYYCFATFVSRHVPTAVNRQIVGCTLPAVNRQIVGSTPPVNVHNLGGTRTLVEARFGAASEVSTYVQMRTTSVAPIFLL